MKKLEELLRDNILKLSPYSCARNEYSGHEATVLLDANENPYNNPYNRYPDPLQTELKNVLAKVKMVQRNRYVWATEAMRSSICFSAASVVLE